MSKFIFNVVVYILYVYACFMWLIFFSIPTGLYKIFHSKLWLNLKRKKANM